MRVVVLGAGAIGSLFGARLAAAGESVLLVGREQHVMAIRADGLTVEGVDPGTFHPQATTALSPGTSAEAVLVTVKSFDLASASDGLGRAIGPTPTALLGNGLGIEEVAADHLRNAGWDRVEENLVRAVHTIPATWLGPGRVRASGTGEVVLPEPVTAGPAAEAVGRLVDLFARGHIPVRTSRSFELELWRKLVVNAAINPVTALWRVPNGALATGPARDEAVRLLSEAVEVARAAGVDLAAGTALADFDRVVRATAQNRSSMLQDLERGRPTEIDAISGALLRRGRAQGLELPATARAVEMVRRATADRPRPAQR